MAVLRQVISPVTETGVKRLTILVEVMLVYVLLSTAIGGWFLWGLVDANHHKANNVGEGLAIIACNAGLARENSILDQSTPIDEKSKANAKSNLEAATNYFHVMPDLNLKYPNTPRDRFGEKCPFPELTRRATILVKSLK